MLPCSVRRVAATAPQTPVLSNFGSSVSRSAASAVALSYRRNQNRRYSSSKPSRDNGSEGLPVGRSAQPADSKASESKATGDKRKRKAKDANEKLRYPSVPSTSHISPDCTILTNPLSIPRPLANNFFRPVLALSSFFSLHRPVSVTRGLPRNVTDDHFAAIFATPTRGAKASDVMNTISRTVEELERPMANLGSQQEAGEQNHSEGAPTKIMLRGADGSEASITMQVNAMSGQFLPFRPPPLPVPQSATSAETSETSEEATAEEDLPHTRTYKAVFTIEETTDGNGEVKIVAHSPKLIAHRVPGQSSESMVPRTFLERMALRQIKYEDAQVQRGVMHAISVRRQRKLKMKKHKYKKLMKKQRHDRLKHGRT